ncbi:MAG: hypothetical protein E7412_00135 [Ruminococcaceae bacterium]|nr:hypothetical protein [Oscillospiraceae bacterium]
MQNIVEAFAPSGCEEPLCELLKNRIQSKFEKVFVDNLGNLAASSGDGRLCIECGMDSTGVMVITPNDEQIRFSAVGNIKPKDIIGRKVVFENASCGKVFCDNEKDTEDAKLSDLYILLDEGSVKKGDFGAIVPDFSEEDGGYTAYGLKNRIAAAAVCKALENTDCAENVTILFSAQKRLGARGLRAFFGVHSFEQIITVDGCTDDGCVIIAKDEKIVANPDLRKKIETLAQEKNLDAETVVSENNFHLEQIAVSCGAPCAAIGISVLCEDGEPERVSKADFDTSVLLIEEILKGCEKKCL